MPFIKKNLIFLDGKNIMHNQVLNNTKMQSTEMAMSLIKFLKKFQESDDNENLTGINKITLLMFKDTHLQNHKDAQKLMDHFFQKDLSEITTNDISLITNIMKPILEKKSKNLTKIDKFLSNVQFMVSFIQSCSIKNKSVEIRKSDVHGNGIFTTNHIKKGQIICFYPIDILATDNNTYADPEELIKYNIDLHDKKTITHLRKYKLNLLSDGSISCMGIPQKKDLSNLFIGHYVNDSASFKFTRKQDETIKDTKTRIRNIVYRYAYNSNNNVVIQKNDNNTLIYLVATKDIPIDHEIFVSYCPEFWIFSEKNKLLLHQIFKDDPKFKLLVFHQLMINHGLTSQNVTNEKLKF